MVRRRASKAHASRLKSLFGGRGKGEAVGSKFGAHFSALLKQFLSGEDGLDRSKGDSAQYMSLRLDNGLQCLLAEDASLKGVGCALSVGVGYFMDPDEVSSHLIPFWLF